MKRVSGTEGSPLIECINPRLSKYLVRWDMKTVETESSMEEGVIERTTSYMEEELRRKPSIDEVKLLILNWYNTQIDEKIISGFTWKEYPIWLSTENQFNYKAAYDLAVQTGGSSLPITFKFGTTENPQYYEFSTVEDITDFYTSAMTYINNTLEQGWKDKDSLDFSEYEKLLS